jgi:hypothetical protein
MNKLFLLPLLLLSACDSFNSSTVNTISYFKDDRTQLCFAASGLGTSLGVLTNVPCTPEVLALIARVKQ